MKTYEAITKYIEQTYSPDAIILYGSYADGSAGEHSDFDALVITDTIKKHDSSVICGTPLDVYVYPAKFLREEFDPKDFLQISDGKIILDKGGLAAQLQKQVLAHIGQLPAKNADELRQEIDWCRKMFARTLREDCEGYYRWHWLLCDSLEIYFDIKKLYYPGPKKAIQYLQRQDPRGFALYSQALKDFSHDSLQNWITYLENSLPERNL